MSKKPNIEFYNIIDDIMSADKAINLVDIMKKVSIRGRMAYAINCLEKVQVKKKITSSELDNFIKILWEFTRSNTLDKWEEEIMSVDRKSMIKGLGSHRTLVEKVIEGVLDVGRGNLYAGIQGFSPATLKAALKLTRLMLDNGIKPMSIQEFTHSPFMDDEVNRHGWGKTNAKFASYKSMHRI